MAQDLKDVICTLRQAAEAAGLPSERLIIAVTDPPVEGNDTAFELHVGATTDARTATLLTLLADDVAETARIQSHAVHSFRSCPHCDSVRYGPRKKVLNLRVYAWDQCLDCGHVDGTPPPD